MNYSIPVDEDPLWPVIICIEDRPVGLGSWVTPSLILTCSHIISPSKDLDCPDVNVKIAPLFAEQLPIESKLIGWNPELDLALLEASIILPATSLPDLRYPERLGFATGGKNWKAWGIPESAVGKLETNISIDASLRRVRRAVRSGNGIVTDKIGSFRYQLRSEGDPLFESGFSGSAVRMTTGEVIGILTSRDNRKHSGTSQIGFLVSMEGIVGSFSQLIEYIGWRFETDGRLKAAWRWEDDDLARPTLGSYFTGRQSALADISSAIKDQD